MASPLLLLGGLLTPERWGARELHRRRLRWEQGSAWRLGEGGYPNLLPSRVRRVPLERRIRKPRVGKAENPAELREAQKDRIPAQR